MNSNEKIKMNIFGKERELKIILVGDNDSEDLYNDEEFVKLMPEEEELLKWILNVDFTEYEEKFEKYINYIGCECCGQEEISKEDLLKDEIFLPIGVLINVTEFMDAETADVALYGESDYLEDAVTIAFKDGEYFGMTGFDDNLNCFEEFE